MQSGFIYILENPAMPGLVKVVKTRRHPNERAFELFTTGVPQKFSITFSIWTDDIDDSEAAIHEYLDEYRVNKSREFFRIKIEHCIKIVIEVVLTQYCLTVVDVDSIPTQQFLEGKAGRLNVHPNWMPKIIECIDDRAFLKARIEVEAKLKTTIRSNPELEPVSE